MERIGVCFSELEKIFRKNGLEIEEARKNAALMLSAATGLSPAGLFLHRDAPLSLTALSLLKRWTARRIAGEPIQYITGETEFYGLSFKVTPAVLVPRPDSEHVVEEAIKAVSGLSGPLIVDLATGSGCIGVTMAKEIPHAGVFATDISEEALEVARLNAETNGVKVEFLQGDLFSALSGKGPFDLIVSNPPYVKTAELRSLSPEVWAHEPSIALDGGEDGLSIIRRIIAGAPLYLKPEGFLILEIGYGQSEAVKEIFGRDGRFSAVEIKKDYSGIERVARASLCPTRKS
jgi:release factor glutamine methyltransferase